MYDTSSCLWSDMAVAMRQDSSQGAGIGVTSTSVEATRVGNVELGRAR